MLTDENLSSKPGGLHTIVDYVVLEKATVSKNKETKVAHC